MCPKCPETLAMTGFATGHKGSFCVHVVSISLRRGPFCSRRYKRGLEVRRGPPWATPGAGVPYPAKVACFHNNAQCRNAYLQGFAEFSPFLPRLAQCTAPQTRNLAVIYNVSIVARLPHIGRICARSDCVLFIGHYYPCT